MESARGKYKALIIIVLLLFGLTISLIYNVAINKIEKSYQENVSDSIIETKKIFLKDTVNNVISGIEGKRLKQAEYYLHLSEDIKIALDTYYSFANESFLILSAELFSKNEDFTALIIETQTDKIMFSSNFAAEGDNYLSAEKIKEFEIDSPAFSRLEYGEYYVVFFVKKELVDKKIKAQIHDELHSYSFSNDAYIWVNEIIDYNGGDNYAVRRIHPNLKDTEGSYLSTNNTDIAGNRPYLTELEGIKQNGELFFNYFFKKNNSDIISEKITYAKLYKEYDWVVAMGVHLDDVKAYVNQATIQTERSIREIMVTVAAITVAIIAAALILFSWLERWYFKNAWKALNDEVCKDSLTIAYNRRGAERHLKSAFLDYKIKSQNSAIIMFDIDDFKKINDICGHDAGDKVLRETISTLYRHIRSTDYLCRWGGDEFLIICRGLREDDIVPFTSKLLGVVSEKEFECSETEVNRHVTVSIGVSNFADMDTDYSAAVKRADKALYCSKAQGKNMVSVEL